MFTIGAFVLAGIIAWYANRSNEKDRPAYDKDEDRWLLTLHIRQDLKVIAFALFGVIVMLGVIADKLP